MIRIKILNPDAGMTQADFALRCGILQEYVGPDVQLDMECITDSDLCLDSLYEAALIAPELIRRAMQAQADGYHAVVLYCFSDPALEACLEVLDIPVVGAGMAACQLVPFVSRQSGLLVMEPKRIPEKREYLTRRGYMPGDISAVHAVDMAGVNVWDSREQAIDRLCQGAQAMIEEQGVQAVILGCLSYLGVAGEMSERLGVPVIDAAVAGVSVAESLVRQGLRLSKKAYPRPNL